MQTDSYASPDPQTSDVPRAVTIDACLFRTSHDAEPHGHGWWTFDFYATGECLERHWRYGGEYSKALIAARAHAERIGAAGVELLP